MIDFKIEEIAPLCAEFGVELDEAKAQKLNLYGNLLIEWNEKINLTAITEPKAVLYKHFYDCILFLKHCEIPKGASLIDVGTGAGFPGMVLKIVRPDLEITLLDSLNKRLVFLNAVIEELGLSDIKTVHLRAEEAGKSKLHREKYDFATARAVANLTMLSELCVPLVKKEGIFLAMKGASGNEEMKSAQFALDVLGCKLKCVDEYELDGAKRINLVFDKVKKTPMKYPRMFAKIKKEPLVGNKK